LISSLLEPDVRKRITTEQILQHPWLRNSVKSKMSLFTAAENILLSKSNVDYRMAGKDDIIENFSTKNLDTIQETENQNVGTKSVILAPFNSSIKIEDSTSLELLIENEVIKYCGKAKELNRKYELDNNGEIDNGIIISPQGKVCSLKLGNTKSSNVGLSPSPFSNSYGKLKSPPLSPPVEVEPISPPGEIKNFVKNGNNLISDHLIIGNTPS
jgi:hypothetical protein